MSRSLDSRPRPLLAAYSLLLSALLGFAVLRLLPVRVLPFDLAVGFVALHRLVVGIGLFHGGERAVRFARISAVLTLAFGLFVTTSLLVSVASVAGVYDSVGNGAAIAFGIVAALVVPYLVVFPALELRALAPSEATSE